jgi:uncharacterized membrane protein YgdD (TMEM256/DUF423 family)
MLFVTTKISGMKTMNYALLFAALLGLSSVYLGAYGDHNLQAQLDPNTWQSWSTALRYHQLYSFVLLIFAGFRWLPIGDIGQIWVKAISVLFSIAIVLFSGSIYLRILMGYTEFTWITPMGGLLLIFSWFFVVMFTVVYRKT